MWRPGLFSRLICGGSAETDPKHTNPSVTCENLSLFGRAGVSPDALTFPRRPQGAVGGLFSPGSLSALKVAGSVNQAGVCEPGDKRFRRRRLPSGATAQRWWRPKGGGSRPGGGLWTTRGCFCCLQSTGASCLRDALNAHM